MSILEEGNDILKELSKYKSNETLKSIYDNSSSVNNQKHEGKKEKKWSLRDNISSNNMTNPLEGNRLSHLYTESKEFRITYLRTVIQFLDMDSIFSLSLCNKTFYLFLNSIYFYKFITQVKEYQNKKKKGHPKKPGEIKEAFSTKKSTGLFSKLTGAFFAFGPSEIEEKKEKDNEIKTIEEKIKLHEFLLFGKLRELEISNQINGIRENIDILIEERYLNQKNRKNLIKENQVISDKEIENIKREKLENKLKEIKKEVENLKNQSLVLKETYEALQKEDIEQKMTLNKIGKYIKSNFTQNSTI